MPLLPTAPTWDQIHQSLQRLQEDARQYGGGGGGILDDDAARKTTTTTTTTTSSSAEAARHRHLAELSEQLRAILHVQNQKDNSEDAQNLLLDAVASFVVRDLTADAAVESFVHVLWQLSYVVVANDETAALATTATTTTTTTTTTKSNPDEPSSSSTAVAGLVTLLRLLRERSSAEVENDASSKDRHERLASALVGCMPSNLLQDSGWIASEAELSKRLRLYNTSQYYKQHRFHLLSEESLGYAQYVRLLLMAVPNASEESHVSSSSATDVVLRRQLASVVGTFSLDPNRCVDVAMAVMAWNLRTTSGDISDNSNHNSIISWSHVKSALDPFLTLFQRYGGGECAANHHAPLALASSSRLLSTSHLPALVAFALALKDNNQGDGGRAGKQQPMDEGERQQHQQNLFTIMVWMVHHHLLNVDSMLEYLPETRHVDDVYRAWHQFQLRSIQQQGRVRLLASSSTDDAGANNDSSDPHRAIQELAQQGLVRWIKTFVTLQQFDLVRPHFDVAFWKQLCCLFPDELGVPILLQTVQPILMAAGATTAATPPWSSSEPSNGVQNDITSHHVNATGLERIRDVLELAFESGCLGRVPVLYGKLCRYVATAIRNHFETNAAPATATSDSAAMDAILDVAAGYLLPSSSLFESNPNLSHEAWNMIESLPYSTRYTLYQEWQQDGRPLWLVEGEGKALKAARYVLKRLSHDTIREQSRALAKVCHSHPLVVFTTILGQIESYDNLVGVMVEALRFVTPLSLDVLAYCILSRLGDRQAQGGGGVNRSRLKEDGVNLSQWLQSLESFVGAFYKRFSHVDCTGLLSYLQHRLKNGHVMEIGLLRTLLKTSAGWAFCDYSPAASLSSSQLEGLSGSALLRRETMTFGVVEAMNPLASERLRCVLQNRDAGVTLLILLAQARHSIIFGGAKGGSGGGTAKTMPVKLVAHLVDSCQVLMAILLDFLTDPADARSSKILAVRPGDVEDATSPRMRALQVYAASLPTLRDLSSRYKVDYASSWLMCRPLIRASTWKQLEADDAQETSCEPAKDTRSAAPSAVVADWMDAHVSGEDSHKLYQEMLPATAWSHITTDLFGTFFTYSLFDVTYPEETYATEIARLEKQAERLAQQKPVSSVSQSIQPGSAPKNDEEELHRVRKVTSRLINDTKKQRSHVAAVRKRIASKKSSFFVSHAVTKDSTIEFLSHCLYQRCMQGPDEALYCAAFISMLHGEGTPGFGTLHLYDVLIVALSRSLFGLTEGEAANVSILLHEVWKVVSRWRYDEAAFEEEVAGKPGSYMVASEGEDPSPITHKDFCEHYNKWHAVLGGTAIGCLQSPQYIHIRNCLIVLTRLVESFPTRPGLANKLLATLEPLQDESNAFADIRASAQAYSKQLMRARDDGVWKEESAAAVKARKEREESAAVARQQQAKRLMAEISREAEQITERIGESDTRGRGMDRRRMEAPAPRSGRSASGALSASPTPPQAHPTSSRDAARDDRRTPNQRPSDSAASGTSGSYTAILSGPGSGRSSAAGGGSSGPRDEAPAKSSLQGRWQGRDRPPGSAGERGDYREREPREGKGMNDRKRSRPSSPAEEGETTAAEESRSSKRARPDDSNAEEASGGRRRKAAGRNRRS